jgi:putative autotransporter adhesin-like protein
VPGRSTRSLDAMPLATRLGLVPLLAATLAACTPHVDGNGVFAERTLRLAAFDRVAIGLGIEATIVANADERSVVISGDENVLEHITVDVASSTLRTDTDLASFSSVHPLRLRIKTPELLSVTALGEARLAVSDAATSSFTVVAEGQSQVWLVGAGGDALEVRLRDRSVLFGFGYPVVGATLDVADGSTAQLHASGPVTGAVAGGPHGGSHVEVQGGGSCSLAPEAGSSCTPPSP